MKNFFISGVFCIYASVAFSETIDVRKINLQVAENILSTINSCGNKVWPGFDLKNLEIVLIDQGSEDQIVVSTFENKIKRISRAAIPASAINASFSFFKIESKSWMSVNALKLAGRRELTFEMILNETFQTAIHEAFHETMQGNWELPDVRGSFVPIKWEPRIYRAMIYKNLVEAFASGTSNGQAMRRAKYWYDQWSKNHPEEVAVTADGYEGTAQYSEFMASAYLNLGCDGHDQKLHSFLLDKVQNEKLYSLEGTFFSLDTEGYEIGLLASLILSHQNSDLKWYDLVKKGETPLAQLMNGLSSEVETVEESFKNVFVKTQATEQAKVDSYLGETYDIMASPDAIYINIPGVWKDVGSFSPFGFYIDPKLNISFMPMASELGFKEMKSDSKLKSLRGAVYLERDSNPCELARWSFVLNNADVTNFENNRIEIKNKSFNGIVSGATRSDDSGRKWFCAGE